VLQSRARAVVRRAAYLTPVLKEYLADRVRLRDELAVRVREAAAQKELLEEAIMARIRLGDAQRLRVRHALRHGAATLDGFDAWLTGVRREQSETRAARAVVAPDPLHGGIVKVAPLAGWTHDQVWDHIRAHRLPIHPLYAQGYTSIGCAPCTRATQPGEDERAGRWYWETGAVKECGINWQPEDKA